MAVVGDRQVERPWTPMLPKLPAATEISLPGPHSAEMPASSEPEPSRGPKPELQLMLTTAFLPIAAAFWNT